MTTSASGNVVTVDARDVVVMDQRPLPAGTTSAVVSFQLTWKGGGGRRRLAASTPAFSGQFFRRTRARGTFAASEEGFAFASDSGKPARSTFAELGIERNGTFLAAAMQCPRCAAP